MVGITTDTKRLPRRILMVWYGTKARRSSIQSKFFFIYRKESSSLQKMLGGSEKWTIPISRVRRAENWARRRRRFRRGGVPLFVQASTSVFPAWPSSTTTRVRYFLFSSEPFPPDRCSSQNWRERGKSVAAKKREKTSFVVDLTRGNK